MIKKKKQNTSQIRAGQKQRGSSKKRMINKSKCWAVTQTIFKVQNQISNKYIDD